MDFLEESALLPVGLGIVRAAWDGKCPPEDPRTAKDGLADPGASASTLKNAPGTGAGAPLKLPQSNHRNGVRIRGICCYLSSDFLSHEIGIAIMAARLQNKPLTPDFPWFYYLGDHIR